MDDKERYASRFSAEVDRILEQQGRAEGQGPPAEYVEMLALAERLAALDFARHSATRSGLWRRLLERLETEHAAVRQRVSWRRRLRLLFSRPRRAWGTLVALAALAALMLLTPAGRTLAQAVQKLVWPHTTVQQLPPDEGLQVTPAYKEWQAAQLAAGRGWQFSFEGYTFGACCYDQPVRNEVVGWSQARAEAGFALQRPAFLPPEFALSEVRLLGTMPYDVLMVYEGTDGRLALYQSPVGVISQEAGNVSRMLDVGTYKAIETVSVGSTQAALLEGEWLVWETGDVSFYLLGPGLDVATLVQIAESLAPAQ